jgi:hypothetical protein
MTLVPFPTNPTNPTYYFVKTHFEFNFQNGITSLYNKLNFYHTVGAMHLMSRPSGDNMVEK